MRLFRNALLREMTVTSGISLGALTAIVVVVQMVRILGNAATGDIAEAAVLPFIAFGFLHFLPVLLSLALYMGVFLTLTRYWQDSEMVIWSCAGLGPAAWIRPVLRFALPVALFIGLISLVLLPWAAQQRERYERYLSSFDEISALTPGVFTESSDGRVFFVEKLDAGEGTVGNIFIQSDEHGRNGIVVAREGHVVDDDNGERYMVLSQGRRYEGTPGAADYKVAEFERYSLRLEQAQAPLGEAKPRQLSSLSLLRAPTRQNQAELVWRLGYPISALILALLAIPLSFYNPRAGRSLNVLFAMLTYTVYNNLIGLSQNWVSHGRLDGLESLLLVHGLALAGLLAAFWWRYGLPRSGRRKPT